METENTLTGNNHSLTTVLAVPAGLIVLFILFQPIRYKLNHILLVCIKHLIQPNIHGGDEATIPLRELTAVLRPGPDAVQVRDEDEGVLLFSFVVSSLAVKQTSGQRRRRNKKCKEQKHTSLYHFDSQVVVLLETARTGLSATKEMTPLTRWWTRSVDTNQWLAHLVIDGDGMNIYVQHTCGHQKVC